MGINGGENGMFVDYDHSIVSLSCSILKHYGAEYHHKTFEPMDELLQHPYKHVVIMLFDGLGLEVLRHHLPENSFLRSHALGELSSVFPPTTTAATTSIESGLTPAEHGWLGWNLYFPELGDIVSLFPNTRRGTQEQAAKFHAARQYLRYRTVYEKIEETGNAKAYVVSLYGSARITKYEELFDTVKGLCRKEERNYIYAYWGEPDYTMHDVGCCHESITEIIRDIDQRVERLCRDLKDTLLIVTADHGHGDTGYFLIRDYPELDRMLERPPVIEARAASFYVKQENLEQFPDLFKRLFGDQFLLLSKEAVLGQNIFGGGVCHPRLPELMGDYLAVAVSGMGINYEDSDSKWKSNHSGFTEREMKVPFIAVEKR